jgi:hypothetical protein
MPTADDTLRFPIGPFALDPDLSATARTSAIDDIAALPSRIRSAVTGLDEAQLDTPYRPGGWTVRQVVHHVADSHMNGFIRVKLALTETHPTIKPYDENAWSRLADMRLTIAHSLVILDGLHARWAALYRALPLEQFARTFLHPEHGQVVTLDGHLQDYAWHSRHHVAHVTSLRQRQGW